MALSAAEVRRHERVDHFTACAKHAAWVHTRGRMHPDSTDGGKDLVLMERGFAPRVVLSGGTGLSAAVWSPSGDRFVVHNDGCLLLGSPEDSPVPRQWLKLPTGEAFNGAAGLVWAREGVVLYSTSGGSPNRMRLYGASPPLGIPESAKETTAVVLLHTAEQGGALLCYDHAPAGAIAAVVHQRANAMLAEVLVVPGVGNTDSSVQPQVIAIDGRVEYCKPHVRFLGDGSLVARLNLVIESDSSAAEAKMGRCTTAIDVNDATPPPSTHGLFILSLGDSFSGASFKAVDLAVDGAEFGDYDVCSSSYGAIGAKNAFILDATRRIIVTTARGYTASTSDHLWIAQLLPAAATDVRRVQRLASPKGCHVPVFLGDDGELVYHFRSPTEWGDLWVCDSNVCNSKTDAKAKRLTHTMPLSLQRKLFDPAEVIINNDSQEGRGPRGGKFHALVFYPPSSSSSSTQDLQPLVWIHGGPMCVMTFDYYPFLCWLASLGYVVCVPNFAGSTGFGINHMDSVLGDGCGVADMSDCVAAAQYLCSLSVSDARVDLKRGVGVAGHSWGGYLSLMCMTQPPPTSAEPGSADAGTSPDSLYSFSCGIALAGIADWFVQQRNTEVRYYDYALMGGWVYEQHVLERARAASPLTRASNLAAPLLVLHGDKDTDVPFQQIVTFVEAARRSQHCRASVEFVSYAGEAHGMSGTKAERDVLDQIQNFLRVNLKPWDFTSNPHGDVATY